MIKVVGLVRRNDRFTFDEFVAYWVDHHSKLVAELPGLRRYVQNPAHEGGSREWPYDGMAELWFDDVGAVKVAFESEHADAVREDETRFVGTLEWFLAEERPVIDSAHND